MTTHDIIIELAAQKIVSLFCFKTFNSYDLIQERMEMNLEITKVLESAMKKREMYHLPFWDSFNLSLFNSDINDYEFLEEVAFHNTFEELISVNASDVSSFLEKVDTDFDYLTINSIVNNYNGNQKHLMLLDFHIPVSSKNQKICAAILQHLKLKGYLLDSGKSYHFFGVTPIAKNKMTKILYQALMFSPILDRAWITHQLIEQSCSLRVSKKYNRTPVVVDKI